MNKLKTPLRLVTVVVIAALAYWTWTTFSAGSSADKTLDKANKVATSQGGSGGGRRAAGGAGHFGAMGPVPIKVVSAEQATMQKQVNALGTVNASKTVVVRTRVEGPLKAINFSDGQLVKAGDLLAQVDPASYQAQLDQAKGQSAQVSAQLTSAQQDLRRYQILYKQDSIAKQQLDTQAALVKQYQAQLKAGQAAVDNAKISLNYTYIKAPISGRLGIKTVDVGNLVSTSDTNGIVTITQTQPADVVFSVPEAYVSEIAKAFYNKAILNVDLYDRSNTTKIASGTLVSMDNQVDPTTGTVKLKARFANDDQSLFPNQFVNVILNIQTLSNITALDTDAIQNGSVGTYVFVVQADNSVKIKTIKTGIVEGNKTQITDGLQAGDNVVIEGVDRLRDGAKVEIVK